MIDFLLTLPMVVFAAEESTHGTQNSQNAWDFDGDGGVGDSAF